MTSVRLRFAALGIAAWQLAACDVATVKQAPSTIALNTCNGDSDCGPGGDCVNSQCRADNGTLQSILFEVIPPANGTGTDGVQFLKFVSPLPSGGAPLGLELDLVSQVTGTVAAGNKCRPHFINDAGETLAEPPKNRTIPTQVTLTASSTTLGLYSPRSSAKSQLVDDTIFQFSANVPPGDYDIYVEPAKQADNSCPVPPQLRRGQQLTGGSLGLSITLPEPSSFDFHLPTSDPRFDGWLVDMLDPVSGRVISKRVVLAAKGKEHVATLSYFPVVVGQTTVTGADQLVRLSPPDDQVAPTVLMARSALCLVDASSCTATPFPLPASVTVHGQVTAQSTPQPVASTVTLVATQIAGIDQGVFASFTRTAVADKDGQFEMQVLPGHYTVSAVPSAELSTTSANADAKLAAVNQEWDVAATPSDQSGKVVTLDSALPIVGLARDAVGHAVTGALVQAVASPISLQASVLEQDLGETGYVPRASSDIIDSEGGFRLLADKGTFDVSVRPLAATGFGWLLFPNVAVGLPGIGANGPGLGMKPFIPPAVVYSGTVTTPGTGARLPVPNALIRAYIYLSKGHYMSDPSKADSVLQVAETRANADGTFEVFIPASVNEPTSQ